MADDPAVPGTAASDSAEPQAAAAGAAATGIVARAAELAEAGADYLAALLRLEGFHVEQQARALLARTGLFVAAGAVALMGAAFLALAGALALGELLGSSAAGFGLIGLLCVLIAGVALLLSRRRPAPREDNE